MCEVVSFPLEKEMITHSSIFLPGKPHEPRSLVGYSPWGCKESDTTEQLSTYTCEKAVCLKRKESMEPRRNVQ